MGKTPTKSRLPAKCQNPAGYNAFALSKTPTEGKRNCRRTWGMSRLNGRLASFNKFWFFLKSNTHTTPWQDNRLTGKTSRWQAVLKLLWAQLLKVNKETHIESWSNVNDETPPLLPGKTGSKTNNTKKMKNMHMFWSVVVWWELELVLRAILFQVIFFFFFLILSYCIPLSPLLLQILPIRITMMPSPGHIYYCPLAMKTPIVFPLESLWIIPMSYALCYLSPYDSCFPITTHNDMHR